MEDGRPDYGMPVVIVVYGTVQFVTYCLIWGGPDKSDYFEPYHFGKTEDELEIEIGKVRKWTTLPRI